MRKKGLYWGWWRSKTRKNLRSSWNCLQFLTSIFLLHAWEIKFYLVWGTGIWGFFWSLTAKPNPNWYFPISVVCFLHSFLRPDCTVFNNDKPLTNGVWIHQSFPSYSPNPTHILQNEFYPWCNVGKVTSQTWKEIEIFFFLNQEQNLFVYFTEKPIQDDCFLPL